MKNRPLEVALSPTLVSVVARIHFFNLPFVDAFKFRVDVSKMAKKTENTEDEILKNRVLTLRAEGEWKLRKGNYKHALSSFSAALDLTPKDKKCLVGRAKCFMRMGQFKNALIDAEASIKEDASFPEVNFPRHKQRCLTFYFFNET
ncbi:hypothetical protein XENORESO_015111 [Xenotaenia resolanae]|uniref:Outer dynein arm-docking complex subunit 4 n=1 Tax=Xenotaenia resolanae TaxID=208358 RepID=A0ABV0WPR7_9TELE